jgi:hypothetical protein
MRLVTQSRPTVPYSPSNQDLQKGSLVQDHLTLNARRRALGVFGLLLFSFFFIVELLKLFVDGCIEEVWLHLQIVLHHLPNSSFCLDRGLQKKLVSWLHTSLLCEVDSRFSVQ